MIRAKKNILMIFLIIFPFAFQSVFEIFIIPMVSPEQMLLTGILAQLIAISVVAILYGRVYCGLLCQLGAAQRTCNLVGSKFFKKRFVFSKNPDKFIRYIKYIGLILAVLFSIYTRKILFEHSPQDQYNFLIPGVAYLGTIILAVIVLGSLFSDSIFCKYLCIHGAFMGLLGYFSPLKLTRDVEACINCKQCSKKCPMNIEIHNQNKVVSKDCTKCRSCEMACPKEGVLSIQFFNKKIPYPVIYVLVALTYVVSLLVASFLMYRILGKI